MIVYQNVCDFCGNAEEIKQGDKQFQFSFNLQNLHEYLEKSQRLFRDSYSGTFCSKSCFLDYFKDHITEDGKLINIGEESE